MAVRVEDADDPLADAFAIIGNGEQGIAGVPVGLVVWWDVIGRVLG